MESQEKNKEETTIASDAEIAMQKKISEVAKTATIEEAIKDNTVTFDFNKETYRIGRPTYQQRLEVNDKRMERYIELLKDKKYMLEDDLKKLYKERGIDVEALLKKIQQLELKKNEYQMKLGEALKKDANENELATFKTEIENILQEQQILSIRRTNLLEYSIENQILIYAYSYLTYLLTEKKEGDNWIKAWKSFDDFKSSEEQLVNLAAFYTSLVTKDVF